LPHSPGPDRQNLRDGCVPTFAADLATELPEFRAELENAGVENLVALPYLRDGVPAGVLAWYF